MTTKGIMTSSRRLLYKILLIVLILSTTSCVRAASEHPVISSTEPEIHERTFEGDYLDSVSFQKQIDIVNWAYGGVIISLVLGYIVAIVGVILIRRKSLKVWHRVILALLVICIFCEGLNFRNIERFFSTSLYGSNQPITIVLKRHTASDFLIIPVWYQAANASMVIWTPLANFVADRMINQSESR